MPAPPAPAPLARRRAVSRRRARPRRTPRRRRNALRTLPARRRPSRRAGNAPTPASRRLPDAAYALLQPLRLETFPEVRLGAMHQHPEIVAIDLQLPADAVLVPFVEEQPTQQLSLLDRQSGQSAA